MKNQLMFLFAFLASVSALASASATEDSLHLSFDVVPFAQSANDPVGSAFGLSLQIWRPGGGFVSDF